jgi:DNA repair exonuclease SbcCD ATPase subunit
MPPPPPPKDASSAPPIDYTLLNELERERALRAKAEARVQTVDSEIEELSVQLFSQANEMVAEERRARAKLEERVETLERRDREKMGRLDRLEKAVSRVERVKALLGEKEDMRKEAAAGSALLSPPARR